MQIDRKTGLVLEGGGMRGVFTSGVLDAFMKHDLYFPYVVAVSAGACNGLSYMSRQPRRARFSNIDMLKKYDYISLKSLLTQGSIFDPNILYERFPNEIVPFDYDAYRTNPGIFEMVTTNCLTGRAEYLTEKQSAQRLTAIVKASSSLPYVAQITEVDGVPMLDGGIIDSIPVVRAIDMGYSPNVVIMTRNRGFRSSERDIKIPRLFYKDYPRLRVALSHRVEVYNRQLELVERMEDWGEIICIRPERPMEVDRICRDVDKLEALYEEGFRLGEAFCTRG
ncbi:Predicted phospholipase, patatin/cPLA2 family [Prevotella aff. ruminicola Tc2-24]|uniref:Predicted phospholipase, patatin/cPLA2 family n=1 Tax=Prevotella aff. ruminicola Tc2-24 TaxID=81582 RepID=A0A1I0PYC8_9BACT|nr:patatin family protein [Prevotella aff. ruminicola Tc2-24]MBR5989112.1 patatin family protein [Prevotella sp.]SEW19569.1 Predicted phospholipase, patatin/cPLA2 family [Prevotella aff. ruminicola Tc2-24]